MTRPKKPGFTLIEMLVVIAIIAILMSTVATVAILLLSKTAPPLAAKTEIEKALVGFDAYYNHFKEYPYDYDNLDGRPDTNSYSNKKNIKCPDYGLLASNELTAYLNELAQDKGMAEFEIVLANIVAVWALSYRDEGKDIGPFMEFNEANFKYVGNFTDNAYLHLNNNKKEPYKSIYGNKALIYLDPWGNPYVFDINWRWHLSTNPNARISIDEHDYVGRKFTSGVDPFDPKNTNSEFFRRGHWKNINKTIMLPVDIWSRGPDGVTDPNNNGLDDNNNGKVDEPEELIDDVVSWSSI